MQVNPTFSEEVINEMNLLDEFLSLTENILVNPFVAGGAPRDWFFNNTCSDIDIFVHPSTNKEELKLFINENPQLQFVREASRDLIDSGAYSIGNIFDVLTLSFNYNSDSLKTIQIVFTDPTGNDLLKTFPVSICCLSYQNYSIRPTELFLKSVRDATLYLPETGQDLRNTPYVMKIRRKFNRHRMSEVSREFYDTRVI